MFTDNKMHFDGDVERFCCARLRDSDSEVGTQFDVIDVPLISQDRWKPINLGQFVRRIQNQGSIGSCNANASTAVLEALRRMKGCVDKDLSAGCLYGQINGGVDQGSAIGDGLRALMEVGTVTIDVIGTQDWQLRRFPSDWKELAAKYRITEAFDAPSFSHLASAIQCKYFLNFGILVGNDFEPDPDGWLPDYKRGGGGHAMMGYGLAYHPTRKVWGIMTANSWGTRWGRNGHCIVPQSYFQRTPFTDGWAVRTCLVPNEE